MQLSVLRNSAEGICLVAWQVLLCLWLGVKPGLLLPAAWLCQLPQRTLFRQRQV